MQLLRASRELFSPHIEDLEMRTKLPPAPVENFGGRESPVPVVTTQVESKGTASEGRASQETIKARVAGLTGVKLRECYKCGKTERQIQILHDHILYRYICALCAQADPKIA